MWLKDVIIDICVTLCIALATLQSAEWAKWVVWIYTPFMLLLKVAAYFGPSVVKKGDKPRAGVAPDWVFHVLYAANLVLLAGARWWLEMAGWLVIWLLSFLAHRKG